MPSTLKTDDRISHYRVVGPLGAGGMGEVYRARDETLDRDVALKILPPDLVRNEERLRRFVLEAKSASSLNHPNIVHIYEIGQDQIRAAESSSERGVAPEPVHFISMELVEGTTLGGEIHREKAELRTLLGWLAQAAEGLAKAHAAGIVHRDLKPGNIMVSKDGYTKVLDFGLAKLTEKQGPEADGTGAPTEAADHTGEGVVLGTTSYMSPEQVQGKPVDARSDVFSFGCVLYESATRRRPFEAGSSAEIMARILREAPAPVEELNPEAPAELRRLIRRCLAKDPNQRPQSMRDLALQVREIVEEYDSLSASASSGSGAAAPAPGPAKRRFAMVATVAVVVAVAAALSGVWLLRRDEGREAGSSFQSMRMTTLPTRGDVSSAVLSPDGRYLAYVSGPPNRGTVWVRQVSTGSDIEVFHAATYLRGLTFSPDGEHLFYLSRDSGVPFQEALYEIPALGGTPIKRGSDLSSGITFAPDGHRICFRRGIPERKRPELIILELKTGQERILTAAGAPAHMFTTPAWSPDGERIAAGEYVSGGGARVVVFGASDGRREVVGTDSWYSIGDQLVWLPDGSGLVISSSDEMERRPQIRLLPYPKGGARRITNDTSSYMVGVCISTDGTTLTAVRRLLVFNLWIAGTHAGGGVQQITFATATENAVSNYASGQDGAILFMSRGASYPLSRIEANGSGPVPLTTEGVLGFRFYSLPSGGVVYQKRGEDGIWHVWLADPDGGNPRQLTAGSGESPFGISPDGRTLLFWRTARPGLWAVAVDGGEPTLIAASFEPGQSPRYSPDSGRIAYIELQEVEGRPRRVCQVIASGGGKPIVTLPLPASADDIEWTPDGKSLTFVDVAHGVSNVFRQRLEGGNPGPITRFTEGEIRDHQWSPDGRRLLLARGDGQVDNIWTTAADGSNAVQLTDFKTGKIDRADWLPPDGRKVVFLYGERGQDVVLIKNFQ